MTETEIDWWDRIGQAKWQHIVLAVAALAAFVALFFAPDMTCSAHIANEPTTTTVPR